MLSFSGMKRFHGGKNYFSSVKMGGKKSHLGLNNHSHVYRAIIT